MIETTTCEDYAFGCLGDDPPISKWDLLLLVLLLPGMWVYALR